MKRNILHILLPVFLFAASVFSGGCVHEFELQPYGEGEMIDLDIPFGAPSGERVTVSTKSELSIDDESHIFNIYLLIFDGSSDSSKKVYGHYFDGNNLGSGSDPSNWWTIDNMPSALDPDTSTGTLHIRTAKKAGCTIVAVANMNPDDLDISPGLLSTMKTYGEVKNVIATQVRSEIAANSGYFLMSEHMTGVDVLGNTSDPNDISQRTLHLRRLYAKVNFEVQIGTAGAAAGISKFIPDKWTVVNVPTCSYLLERDPSAANHDASSSMEDHFFSTEEKGFETEKLAMDPANPSAYVYYNDGVTKASCHGFSFYMMENRKAPYARTGDTLPSPFAYTDRELENKLPSGANNGWRYADDRSTYVILTGKIQMRVTSDLNSSNTNATLDANVKYKIHLGNFGSGDYDDFNVLRNHNYLYKIYINGANDIKTEVLTDTENEPGATGRVVVAEEKVFDSDCHYSTQVISFHYNLIDPSQISWYVETPFNPEGAGPDDGLELSDIDYKWVEFHVNDMQGDGTYSQKRVEYKPHDWPKYDELGIAPGTKGHTMYVNELVEYLRHQKNQYDIHAADPTLPKSDFDDDVDELGNPDPKISVTAFVNEYYYEEHPTKGGFDPTLWKLVVNHPMRRLHILASSKKSRDGESMSIGSSFTLQQRSIQSIYAIHDVDGLHSAWGMEFSDDTYETGLSKFWRSNATGENLNNFSTTNGRENTLKLWEIIRPDGSSNPEERYWETYLNLNGENETARLKDDYNYLRYSCLSRNRDNDGDGIIDPEEIRWYMASDIQLIGVFLGSYSIEGDARLYQKSAEDREAPYSQKDKWRQHVVASNMYIFPPAKRPDDWPNSFKYARVIWAEEGINGSQMSYKSNSEQTTYFSTRCVRNLGYYHDDTLNKDIDITQAPPEREPDPYVTVSRKHLNTDGTVSDYPADVPANTYNDRTFYQFDCSRINATSLREPVDHELVAHDENSPMACLSRGFVTIPVVNAVSLSNKTNYEFPEGTHNNLQYFNQLDNYLSASFGGLDVNFSVCPAGYRLPNVREMAVIWNVLSSFDTGDTTYLGHNETIPSRTHWSLGALGSGKVSNYWGWGMTEEKILMAINNNHKVTKPRCVKDL
ncbi:MAG: DUF4906 domain-containing protein [Bacteroidales bacterium]|nr:DUF4906 domain-containing protein [Bacteroidales bacterium]